MNAQDDDKIARRDLLGLFDSLKEAAESERFYIPTLLAVAEQELTRIRREHESRRAAVSA